jgi:hypothetical protein
MLLVRKNFLRKKQNRDHTQQETATKIPSGQRKLPITHRRGAGEISQSGGPLSRRIAL